ncbi:MAG TPA: hypothetical protein VGQ85_10165 [Candidatus Limnocylindrales bacterium]|nr:hypothetical protein [Candidatus Limnocylindrales bacterium]
MTGNLSRRLATVATTALLGTMLLGVGTANAAVPTLTPTFDVLSPVVTNGDIAGFRATITNNDTSTVSQLFLVDKGSDGTLFSVTTTQGRCNAPTAGPLYCAFGQLKPGKTLAVVFTLTTLAAPASADLAKVAFNTTGLGSGGGDNSHGDSWPSTFSSVTLTNSDDFGGRYVANNNLKLIQNLQALSNANPHSTKTIVPSSDIYATVEDIDCTTSTDSICLGLTTGFGQVSKVNVNNGNDVSGTAGTTLLHFTIQTYAGEVPSGKNANNIFVLHTYAGVGSPETISQACTFSPKNNPVPANAPCITVLKLGGGSFQVDVWTFHNGGLRLQ